MDSGIIDSGGETLGRPAVRGIVLVIAVTFLSRFTGEIRRYNFSKIGSSKGMFLVHQNAFSILIKIH